ncbi:MAG: hypothetical protein A3K19_28185 [Lentisphaerae bacterium RIFOXYB12_FULL_65_16]|nr:MAG: hypothetical protein A3K18_34255 [Lentisphaerae bacterium RIFOXYA12_64_32]OGV85470.1 MAG: hypothetical protein A3K19_28185 [Lentisphaerae bacterium RIFOXYB12_FULL_65_16]
MRRIQDKRTNVVLLGRFNPAIFQPAWFVRHGLLRQEEGVDEDQQQGADVRVVHPEVTEFATEWLVVQILKERFQARPTRDGHDEEVRDLVLGTFRLLRHTPVETLGINTTAHWVMDSEEQWNRLGDVLAPKDVCWGEVMEKPGLRSLIMHGTRSEGPKGHVLVRVEPSSKDRFGVFVEINDHYEVNAPQECLGAEEVLGLLETRWSASQEQAERVIARLVGMP